MKLLATLLLGLVLFAAAAAVPPLLGFDGLTYPWMPQVLTKILMLIEAAVLIAVSRRPAAEFGFRRGHGPSAGLITMAVVLGALMSVLVLIAGLEGLQRLMKGHTFLQIVLAIWIWSSVVEEIFVRGWLQTTLESRGASPRAQILLSGAFFGAIHLSLLVLGVHAATVAVIVIATFLLGLICATLRQRTGSLVAPIVAHIGFNVGGAIGGIIGTIVRKVTAQ
jgi:membrane protease YdiL (CAAX protease family)